MNQFDLKENCEKMVSRCKSMLNTCCFFISDCETEGYTCSELPLDPDKYYLSTTCLLIMLSNKIQKNNLSC